MRVICFSFVQNIETMPGVMSPVKGALNILGLREKGRSKKTGEISLNSSISAPSIIEKERLRNQLVNLYSQNKNNLLDDLAKLDLERLIEILVDSKYDIGEIDQSPISNHHSEPLPQSTTSNNHSKTLPPPQSSSDSSSASSAAPSAASSAASSRLPTSSDYIDRIMRNGEGFLAEDFTTERDFLARNFTESKTNEDIELSAAPYEVEMVSSPGDNGNRVGVYSAGGSSMDSPQVSKFFRTEIPVSKMPSTRADFISYAQLARLSRENLLNRMKYLQLDLGAFRSDHECRLGIIHTIKLQNRSVNVPLISNSNNSNLNSIDIVQLENDYSFAADYINAHPRARAKTRSRSPSSRSPSRSPSRSRSHSRSPIPAHGTKNNLENEYHRNGGAYSQLRSRSRSQSPSRYEQSSS